jgi:amino acid transporter
MAAWTITGFESAANLAEETEFPEARVPFAIVSSEVFSVIIGFIILLGFTLAIPSLDGAVASPVPFAYIMAHHFSRAFTDIVMGIILLEIYACSLANLTILGRVLWAMARDRQLPASSWFGALNTHKVPANAMWLSAMVAVAFTWWARFQTVIAGVSSLAAYATYQMVVVCALLNRHQSGEPIRERREAIVPRALGISALAWLLTCMGALALPRSAWSNDKAILVGLIFGLCVRMIIRGRRGELEKRSRIGEVTS